MVAYESSPGSARPFCGACGSRVPSPWQGEIAIPAASCRATRACARARTSSRNRERLGGRSRGPYRARAGSASGGVELASDRARREPGQAKLRGACLCGDVAYELDAPLAGEIWCCHCTRCQRAHAAAHATNLFLPRERFRWLRGEELVRSYKIPEALRFTQFFCARCGGSLPKARADRPYAVIPAGTLEDDPGIRPGRHIYVSDRAAWDEIADGLPQFPENAPDHPFASPAAAAR